MKRRFRYTLTAVLASIVLIFTASQAGAWNSRNQIRRPPHEVHHKYSYSAPQVRDSNLYRAPGDTPNRYSFHKSLAYAWEMLKADRSHIALNVFGRAARAHPSGGEPKIGYAIAMADLGQLGKSLWAMKRALVYDPGAIRSLTADRRFVRKMGDLASQYRTG